MGPSLVFRFFNWPISPFGSYYKNNIFFQFFISLIVVVVVVVLDDNDHDIAIGKMSGPS